MSTGGLLLSVQKTKIKILLISQTLSFILVKKKQSSVKQMHAITMQKVAEQFIIQTIYKHEMYMLIFVVKS
jgi:hypothetical protein